jgi:hypothetical protein
MSAYLYKSAELVPTVPDGVAQGSASASGKPRSALLEEPWRITLQGERLLAAEAMQLLLRLDSELLDARAQWNQDWFRRIMRIRPKAVSRLRRRWGNLNPTPAIHLGSLRRRCHANLAGSLYEQ